MTSSTTEPTTGYSEKLLLAILFPFAAIILAHHVYTINSEWLIDFIMNIQKRARNRNRIKTREKKFKAYRKIIDL